jgi:large subunit ribosomal protein L6
MSRIGKQPIDLPAGVEVKQSGSTVTVKGALGEMTRSLPESISFTQEGSQLLVTRPDETRANRSLHGLTRSLLNNMVVGVSKGFSKTLLITGVGYRAIAKGTGLEFALGYSHPIIIQAPNQITFEAPKPTEVIIKGIDKEVVGQVAANIRALRKPEPYKGKGIRYSDERIIRKAGKAASK